MDSVGEGEGGKIWEEFPESYSFLSFVMIHLSGEETEALRGYVTCPGSLSC